MKKWVKRSIGAALLAVTAVGLTACGSKSASNSDVPTLLMYQIGDKPKNYDTLIAKTNKILEKKAKAKIKIQYIGWGDYTQKMSVIVSSGEKYDIAKADNYAVNAQKGAYTDLTKLLPKYAPTAYKDLDPAYIKGNKVDGKLYTMPINGNVYAQQVVSFNKKYLDKYNIDVSKINSYKDLEDTFAKFHSADKKVLTFSTGPTFHIGSDLDFVIDQDYPFAVNAVNKGKKLLTHIMMLSIKKH
jgi:ABC-type sugar transport system, periplasmic component